MKVIAGIVRTMLLVALASASATEAHADWLIVPFGGAVFGGNTTIPFGGEGQGSSKIIFGASGAWLSSGIIGIEADWAFAPSLFDDPGDILNNDSVLTLSGSVIAAVPVSVTRESLRPYATGGLGLVHASFQDIAGILDADSDLLAMNLGGGAIGFLSRRTGLRFELRHFRSLNRDVDLTTERRSKLRFWRATVGVVFRY